MIELLAIGGVIITALLAMLGYKNSQIDTLEDENKSLEVKDEITTNQNQVKKEIIKNESSRIKAKVKKKSKASRRTRLNNL